jgi:hypothetical protein
LGLRRRCGDLVSKLEAKLGIEIEAKLRQLDRDIAVDAGSRKLIQDLNVTLTSFASFLWGGNIFTQMIEDDSTSTTG